MLVLDGCATVWDDVEWDGVTMTGGCSDLSVFSNVPKLSQQDPPSPKCSPAALWSSLRRGPVWRWRARCL